MKFSFFLLCLIFPFLTLALTFNQTLKLGSQSEEVGFLQSVLNQDPATQVTPFGPGSPGMETNYFGPATRLAVIKFQEKYRQEVLLPLGLNKGTGVVGLLTRLKLQNIANAPTNKAISAPIVSSPSSSAPTSTSSQSQAANPSAPSSSFTPSSSVKKRSTTMKIISISPTSASGPTQIQIKGEGFSKTANKIYTGYSVLENIPSSDGQTLSFYFNYQMKPMSKERMSSEYDKYPVVREIPLGIYVENETGVSNGALFHLKY